MRKALIVSALAALCLSATAQADPSTLSLSHERVTLDVPYGDLDLSRPAGAKTMVYRIRHAAADACGGEPFIREMRERRVFKVCLRQAMAEAIDELRAPLVTAMYERELAENRLG
jgi:UrcA family protein